MTNPTQPFLAAYITMFQAAGSSLSFRYGWASTPWAALDLTAPRTEETAKLYASDAGYRTRASDPDGVIAYPPVLVGTLAIDRQLALDPGQTAAGWGWGTLAFANDDDAYSSLLSTWTVDGRAVEVRYGEKTYDTTRGIFVDPAIGDTKVAFSGIAESWSLTVNQLQIPIRDATYWLERPIQSQTYLGTGTYEGGSNLTGKPKPILRGACLTILPVLIDPTNRIYQVNNGYASISALYEGGATTITFQADTSNLYSGSTTAGQYRTDVSRGLFQLGSAPVRTITCDATGRFPTAGAKSVAADIAYYLLTEDLALPTANIAGSTFTSAATDYPYAAGVYFAPDDNPSGVAAVSRLLSAFGAKLIPTRAGTLSLIVLRAIVSGATPTRAYTADDIVSLVPTALPATLTPPPYRIRVAYQHNYFVQTSDLSASVTAAQREFVQSADRFAAASSGTISLAYARPSDPSPFGGALTSQTDAQAVADAVLALFATRRRLFDMTVPVSVGINNDIGDVIQITYPLDNMSAGQLGRIVGEQFRPNGSTITVRVLV